MLNLREILAQRFEAHLELLSILERAPLLELINLFQQWNTLHASLLGIVAQVAQAIAHSRSDLNHLLKGVHLSLQDLSEDLVDVDAGHDDFGDEELDVQLERQELFLQLPLEHCDEVLSVDFIHGQLHRVKIDSATFTSGRGNHLDANILEQALFLGNI